MLLSSRPCISAKLCRRPAAFQPVRVAQVRGASGKCAATHKICVLPGDGIGPEIMEQALKVLTGAGEKENESFVFDKQLIGGAAIDATGSPLPAKTLEAAKASDAVLLAAIGGYKWDHLPSAQKPEKGLLNIRAGLNAFANLRPAIVPKQLAESSPLKREIVEGVDILIVRELVGGIYFGQPRGFGKNEAGERTGYNTDIYSVSEVERIARVAFEAARKRPRRRLCSVDKANVLEVSQLWRQVVTELGAKEYPDVELSHMYIDNAAMQLIRNPRYFDVVVTGNIFGDILSDEASMLGGSLGLLPSASLSSSGPGIFEPVHGSAPDIAGKDVANPLGMVLSAAMMCRYNLNLPRVAERLEQAVNKALDDGFRTADLFHEGSAGAGTTLVGCSKMGQILLNNL